MSTLNSLQLGSLQDFFITKTRELKTLIDNLQITELREDSQVDVVINSIKQQILLKPVEFGDFQIVSNRSEARNIVPNFQQMWGGTRTFEIITIDITFEGSKELFRLRKAGVMLNDGRFYQPGLTNKISLEVELSSLNKEEALLSARQKMAQTFELINQNNPDVTQWSSTTNTFIEQLVQQKREELIKFYG